MTKPTIHFTTRSDRIRRARRDPLVARLSALVIAGVVVAPVAVLIGHSHGHHAVRSGSLPGAAVGLTPGPTDSSDAAGATTSTVAPAATTATPASAPVPATLPPTAVSGTLPPTAVTAGTLPATIPPPTSAGTTADLSALSSGDGSSAGAGSPGSGGSSGASGGSGGDSGSIWGGGSQAAATTTAAPVVNQPAPPPTTQAPAPRSWDVAAIQQIIRNVFPDDQEEHALAIAYRESHYDPYAHNYCCTGLFQIYGSVHHGLINSLGFSVSQLTDPYVNTVVAYALYKIDGWGPWGG
jgi:hypothetical protein